MKIHMETLFSFSACFYAIKRAYSLGQLQQSTVMSESDQIAHDVVPVEEMFYRGWLCLGTS